MNWSNFFDGIDGFQFKNSALVAGVFDTSTPLISVYGRGDVGHTFDIINKEPSHKFSNSGIRKLMRARMLNIPCVDLVGWEDKEYLLYHGDYYDIKKYVDNKVLEAVALTGAYDVKSIKADIVSMSRAFTRSNQKRSNVEAYEAASIFGVNNIDLTAIDCSFVNVANLKNSRIAVINTSETSVYNIQDSNIYILNKDNVKIDFAKNCTVIVGEHLRNIEIQGSYNVRIIVFSGDFKLKENNNVNITFSMYSEADREMMEALKRKAELHRRITCR
mgnify:FL=1